MAPAAQRPLRGVRLRRAGCVARALESGSGADDTTYTSIEDQINTLTASRDSLAGRIRAALDNAAFHGTALNNQQAKAFIDQAQTLIDQAHSLAGL